MIFRNWGPVLLLRLCVCTASMLTAAAPLFSAAPRVVSIQFTGNSELSSEELQSILPFTKGVALSDIHEKVAVHLVDSYYGTKGFLQADVSMNTSVVGSSATTVFSIHEGPRWHFGATRVLGMEKLPEKMVRNKLTYQPGDPYISTALFESQSLIYGTGLFEDVSINVDTSTAHTAEVTIRVEERKLKWIKGGVGWGSEEKQRLTLMLTHENFLHRGYRSDVVGTVSSIWQEYRYEFLNHYLFNTQTEERASLSWRSENREGYDFERVRVENRLGRKLTKYVNGSLNYRFDRNIVFNTNPNIADTTPNRSDTRAVNVGLGRDTTDDIFFPRHGARNELFVERAGGLFGGLNNFDKASWNSYLYHPVAGPVVAAFAFRSGIVEEFGSSMEVPVFDRFFIGGANTIRGYRERSVGPKGLDDDPLGGKYLLGSTLEFRYPLFWKLNGAVFLDGGQVGFRYQDVKVSKWKYGAGTGVRLATPVGPLRLDFGYKLNPETDEEDLWRLHLSFGESF